MDSVAFDITVCALAIFLFFVGYKIGWNEGIKRKNYNKRFVGDFIINHYNAVESEYGSDEKGEGELLMVVNELGLGEIVFDHGQAVITNRSK